MTNQKKIAELKAKLKVAEVTESEAWKKTIRTAKTAAKAKTTETAKATWEKACETWDTWIAAAKAEAEAWRMVEVEVAAKKAKKVSLKEEIKQFLGDKSLTI